MKANKLIQAVAATAFMMLLTGSAQAAATYCAPNASNIDGLAVSDMTFNGGATNANDCYGLVTGNDDLAYINSLAWGNDWNFLIKDDNPGANPDGAGLFKGLNFALSASAGTTGDWTLTAQDNNSGIPLNLPAKLDFVGVLKGSNKFALYFFDDVLFDGSNGGTWAMKISNKKGTLQDLSHLDLYIRDNCPAHNCGDIKDEFAVPEPGMLALLGLGLFGLGFFRRKKSQ